MPNVLILCAHRPNRSPSQRYRFEQYLPYLSQNGFSFTWSYLLNEKQDEVFYSKGHFIHKIMILTASLIKRVRDVFRFKNFDIIFIQREAAFLGTSFFEKRAFKSGARVIFDFDDSIWLADTSPGNKKWERIKKPAKFFKNILYAHAVIAGNKYLAGKVLPYNKNVVVIPTTINTEVHVPLPMLRHKDVVTVGWSGSISTVKHFNLIVPVLKRLKQRYGNKVKFRLVGDKSYTNSEIEVEAFQWSEETEVDLLNTFDIGLMPLPDDEWANGKCGLKALSYMACGIPTVMSAIGVNKEIVDDELRNGFLASTDEDWFEILCSLVESNTLRSNVGYRARETVIEKYSVEANKNKYLEVFMNEK